LSGIIYVILAAGALIAHHGGISSEIIYEELNGAIENFVEINQDILLSMYVQIDESGSEEEIAKRHELRKQEHVMNFKMLAPMIFIVYMIIIAYFSTMVFRIIYNIFIGSRAISYPLKRIEWRIKLSGISAVIIILCAVSNLLLYSLDNPFPRIIVTNIQFILAPGFCIMGMYFLYDKIYNMYNKNRYTKGGIAPAFIMLAACAVTLLVLQYAGLAILVICGLYAALIGDIKKFYDKTKKAVFGDDDEDDDDF